MGKIHQIYLSGDEILVCSTCQVHLTTKASIISKAFRARLGTGYLIDQCENVIVGSGEERIFSTGHHYVKDIYCIGCDELLGWKYIRAYEESQKYKENKYILEKKKITDES